MTGAFGDLVLEIGVQLRKSILGPCALGKFFLNGFGEVRVIDRDRRLGRKAQKTAFGLFGENARAGVAEIALADTIGVADPWLVRKRVEATLKIIGDIPLRLHFHDTRNTGLANAFAGVEAGVSILDASVGGLGGCPFAPDATGNIGTEDLAYMLERAGFETGYDLPKLIETARWVSGLLGKPPASSVSRAGLFPST